MAKLDENDTIMPEAMLPDFGTGGKIDPLVVGRLEFERKHGVVFCEPTCFLRSTGGMLNEKFVSLLAARVAKLVVAMTQGTCKCGKPSDACCQAT